MVRVRRLDGSSGGSSGGSGGSRWFPSWRTIVRCPGNRAALRVERVARPGVGDEGRDWGLRRWRLRHCHRCRRWLSSRRTILRLADKRAGLRVELVARPGVGHEIRNRRHRLRLVASDVSACRLGRRFLWRSGSIDRVLRGGAHLLRVGHAGRRLRRLWLAYLRIRRVDHPLRFVRGAGLDRVRLTRLATCRLTLARRRRFEILVVRAWTVSRRCWTSLQGGEPLGSTVAR